MEGGGPIPDQRETAASQPVFGLQANFGEKGGDGLIHCSIGNAFFCLSQSQAGVICAGPVHQLLHRDGGECGRCVRLPLRVSRFFGEPQTAVQGGTGVRYIALSLDQVQLCVTQIHFRFGQIIPGAPSDIAESLNLVEMILILTNGILRDLFEFEGFAQIVESGTYRVGQVAPGGAQGFRGRDLAGISLPDLSGGFAEVVYQQIQTQ